MNKKGFTLVELLAVIAILAILVIIALPNVMEMFNNAKESTFVTEVQAIYKQVATDFVSDSLSSYGEHEYCQADALTTVPTWVSDNCTTSATVKKLNLSTTKNYYVKVGSDGSVQKIVVYDGSFAYAGTDVAKATDITKASIKKADKVSSLSVTNATLT